MYGNVSVIEKYWNWNDNDIFSENVCEIFSLGVQ